MKNKDRRNKRDKKSGGEESNAGITTHNSKNRDDNCRNERWRRETSDPLWKKYSQTFLQYDNVSGLMSKR